MYQEVTSWCARYLIFCMINTHKFADVNLLTSLFLSFYWYSILSIPIKILPITFLMTLWPISGYDGSYTNLGLYFWPTLAMTCTAESKCPSLGNAWYYDNNDTLVIMLILPCLIFKPIWNELSAFLGSVNLPLTFATNWASQFLTALQTYFIRTIFHPPTPLFCTTFTSRYKSGLPNLSYCGIPWCSH